jgi:hypothetical protein
MLYLIQRSLANLFPDTKFRKDAVQKVVSLYFSHYLAQMMERFADIHCQEIRADSLLHSSMNGMDRCLCLEQ